MERLLPALMLASACSGPPPDARPAAPEQICDDDRVSRTFGGDPHRCRDYLAACVDDLTDAQRAEWRHAVIACLGDRAELFSCFSRVPWC